MRKFLIRVLNRLIRGLQPAAKTQPNAEIPVKAFDASKKYRVALCFSGQIRNLDKGFEYIFKSIIQPNQADCEMDVFVHAWFDQSDIGKTYTAADGTVVNSKVTQTALMDIYKYYNPEKMLLEKQIVFDEKNYNENKPEKIIPRFSLSKNYSMKKSLELKKQHETEKNFTYDYIMTVRFDLGLSNPIIFRNFDASAVTASENGAYLGEGIDVTHSVMGSGIADVYATFFDHMDQYYKEGIRFCDEPMMHRHLDANNIKFIRTPSMNNYILLR